MCSALVTPSSASPSFSSSFFSAFFWQRLHFSWPGQAYAWKPSQWVLPLLDLGLLWVEEVSDVDLGIVLDGDVDSNGKREDCKISGA